MLCECSNSPENKIPTVSEALPVGYTSGGKSEQISHLNKFGFKNHNMICTVQVDFLDIRRLKKDCAQHNVPFQQRRLNIF